MAKDKEKEPIKRFYEKDRNRFMALRFESDTDMYPTITATEVSKRTGYSKGTINSLEDTSLSDLDVLTKQAGILKEYHDLFGCSYEYLFGETEQRDPKFSSLDKSSPLTKLDSKSLSNLEQLLSSKGFEDFNSYMLKAFIANPSALQSMMNTLFRFMYVLNQIYSNDSLSQAEKELAASQYWYSLNTNLDVYLRDSLLPNLQVGFERYEQKEKEQAEKKLKEEQERDEQLLKKIDEYQKNMENEKSSLNVGTVTSVKVIPLDNKEEDGQ